MIKSRTARRVFILMMIETSLFSSFMEAAAMQPRKLFESDYFNYDGHVFFNVSQSGAQGEKYLLNEQLSNIKLATDWRPASWVKWHGLLIYNTSPTPITPALYFEQAFFDFQSGRMPDKYISIGKKWLPFGSYKNDLIYKPLTKALGQTNELALELGYDNVNYASLSFYKPHSTIRSAALPVYYNLNAGRRNQFFDIGASYLYSITDSQLFQYNKGLGGFLGHTVENQVPGAAVYANLKYQDFNTNLTYVTAVRAFHANEMSYQAQGAKPAALSVQSGYEFDVRQIPVKFIGFYDHSLQALALKLPRKRAGIGLNIYPSRFLDVQFQVFKDYNYANGVNAAGLNQSVSGNSKITNTVAMQLVLNF